MLSVLCEDRQERGRIYQIRESGEFILDNLSCFLPSRQLWGVLENKLTQVAHCRRETS